MVEVQCEGRPFFITQNLYRALWQLRLPDRSRRLWVDAICINQYDVTERSQGVSMMRQIYSGAQRVDVWLGPCDESTADAIALLETIATNCCMSVYGAGQRSWWLQKLKQEDYPNRILQDGPLVDVPDASCLSWQSVKQYYDRDWFTRVWVLQEVQNGADVRLQCGDHVIEWEFVALAAVWITYASPSEIRRLFWKSEGPGTAQTMRDRLRTKRDVPFLLALDQARRFRSTDPRDKVFSLLQHSVTRVNTLSEHHAGNHADSVVSMISPTDRLCSLLTTNEAGSTHLDMLADYSMTASEVYREVAVRSIQQYNSLEVFWYVDSTPALCSLYPSWIPRWDLPSEGTRHDVPSILYDASAGEHPSISSLSKEGITLRGVQVGSITRVQPVFPIGGENPSDSPSLVTPSSTLSKDRLASACTVITQDIWSPGGIRRIQDLRRAHPDLGNHFADFASFILEAVGDGQQDMYVALDTFYCDRCNGVIVPQGKPSPAAPQMYHCASCSPAFGMCGSCFTAGENCLGTMHSSRPKPVPAVHYVRDTATLERLRQTASVGCAEEFGRRMIGTCYNRTFFATAEGWIGSGLDTILPGDVVVVLYGGTVPYVLRKQGCGAYRLIGCCHEDGLMDGEAVKMSEDGELVELDFALK
ncbi:hypothetical protein B0A55_09631 [Friedmanniomyces simplex]|uniref:Heterokaryon incompatibility domain-containing protein n=1 Tax=Friedmanniomyces simplex TaxID=329884 RepID=A0A4U0X232_9PEZI|nr:hypothetical protein B0A55_09631 [Friedmanniomyces simplex]